jgi:hypothetical protein
MQAYVAPRYHHQTVRAARTVSGLFGLYGFGDTGDPVVDSALAAPVIPDPTTTQGTMGPGTAAAGATQGMSVIAPIGLWAVVFGIGIGATRGAFSGGVAARSWPGAARGALFDGGLAATGAGLAYALIGGDGSKAKAAAFGALGLAALAGSIVWAVRGTR